MQPRLAQVVAGQIREWIIGTHMNAGDKMPTESDLMARYQVSRSTIREAVKILQAENIVEVRHGCGSFVAANTGLAKDPLGLSFSKAERLLPETMELRLLLEPGIAALAAQRCTSEDLNRMHKANKLMEDAAARGEDYHAYDYQFHISVAQSTHNGVVKRMFPVILEAIERGYAQTANVQGSFERAVSYHKQIFRAIQEGNASDAQILTQKHIQQTLRDITEQTEGETT